MRILPFASLVLSAEDLPCVWVSEGRKNSPQMPEKASSAQSQSWMSLRFQNFINLFTKDHAFTIIIIRVINGLVQEKLANFP